MPTLFRKRHHGHHADVTPLDELVLHHPEGYVDAATAFVVIGGPALYLLSAALFKLSVFGNWSVIRFGGIAALLALIPLATVASPLMLSAASTTVLVIVATIEGVLIARHPERYRVEPGANAEQR